MACLGSAEGRARVLAALSSPDDKDVQIAEVYLGHRPISDVQEFRAQAHRIARMNASPAQVRALDTLGRHRLSDPDSLDAVAGIFTQTESVEVQRAVADLIIRSDYRALAPLEFARVLAEHRLKSPTGKDIIDILIRRLQSPASPAVVARARPIEVPPMW
jgi:hypothetical protein